MTPAERVLARIQHERIMEEVNAIMRHATMTGTGAMLGYEPRSKETRQLASFQRDSMAWARLKYLQSLKDEGFKVDERVIEALKDQLVREKLEPTDLDGKLEGFAGNPIYGGGAGPGTPMPGVLPFHDPLKRKKR